MLTNYWINNISMANCLDEKKIKMYASKIWKPK